jgi:hypothetical protein
MPYAIAAIVVTLGLYFFLGFRRFTLLVVIPGIIGLTIYFSWYYFSGQYEKDRSAEKKRLSLTEKGQHATELWEKVLNDTRRIERNTRAGYHYQADPEDSSPLGVLRFEVPEYKDWNDEDFILKIRDRFYPSIPKDKFDQWVRDAFGQEKIDAYLEQVAKAK